MIFIGLYAKFHFGFMQNLHSPWLVSSEKLDVLLVTLKKIMWQWQTEKFEEEAWLLK